MTTVSWIFCGNLSCSQHATKISWSLACKIGRHASTSLVVCHRFLLAFYSSADRWQLKSLSGLEVYLVLFWLVATGCGGLRFPGRRELESIQTSSWGWTLCEKSLTVWAAQRSLDLMCWALTYLQSFIELYVVTSVSTQLYSPREVGPPVVLIFTEFASRKLQDWRKTAEQDGFARCVWWENLLYDNSRASILLSSNQSLFFFLSPRISEQVC